MCVLGTLNAIPFDKQIYLFKVQKLSGDFWNLKSEVRSLKSKIPVQNGCQKTHTRNFNQSIIYKITQQNLKWPPQKLIKPSPNIIVTLKVTIPLKLDVVYTNVHLNDALISIDMWIIDRFSHLKNRDSWSSRHVVLVNHVCYCLTASLAKENHGTYITGHKTRSGHCADDVNCWHRASLSIADMTCQTIPNHPSLKHAVPLNVIKHPANTRK